MQNKKEKIHTCDLEQEILENIVISEDLNCGVSKERYLQFVFEDALSNRSRFELEPKTGKVFMMPIKRIHLSDGSKLTVMLRIKFQDEDGNAKVVKTWSFKDSNGVEEQTKEEVEFKKITAWDLFPDPDPDEFEDD